MHAAMVGARLLFVLAATAALAACGRDAALRPSSGAEVALASIAASSPLSSIRPLLYVSDLKFNYEATFLLPQFYQQQTHCCFSGPAGECVDANANIWTANSTTSNIVEYGHGGDFPITSLADPGYYPFSCAVDRTTGDLAVGNRYGIAKRVPGIIIYKHAAGNGIPYVYRGMRHVYFMDYDPSGTLFLDGLDPRGQFALASFAHGTFTQIALKGTKINVPGGVQYADGSLTVGDQFGFSGHPVIYRITDTGRTVGSVALKHSANCAQYFIYHALVICPDTVEGNVRLYGYPSGVLQSIYLAGFGQPEAAVVSP